MLPGIIGRAGRILSKERLKSTPDANLARQDEQWILLGKIAVGSISSWRNTNEEVPDLPGDADILTTIGPIG